MSESAGSEVKGGGKLSRGTTSSGSPLETRVSFVGDVLLGIGILGMVLCFVAAWGAAESAFRQAVAERSSPLWYVYKEALLWIVASFSPLICGILMRIVCHVVAEFLRILKKIAGLPYAGEIS